MGKGLMVAGALLVLLGGYLALGLPMPPFGRLPGDIRIERDNLHFYFPITTCLLLSGVLSLILWVLSKFKLDLSFF